MIKIDNLGPGDIGRNVDYHPKHGRLEHGHLTSWNARYVFVRFKGPNGEACHPNDVTFSFDHLAQQARKRED